MVCAAANGAIIIIGDGPLAVGKGAPDSGGIVGAPHEPPWNLGARDLRQRTDQRSTGAVADEDDRFRQAVEQRDHAVGLRL